MDVNHLRSFCAVVDERSFGRAASRLQLTQPAISMHVKALEQDLGEVLLLRSRRGVEATEAGHILYRHAQRLFTELAAARQHIDELRDLQRGHLRIGCSDTVSTYILMPVLASFSSDYPGIAVSIRNRPTLQIAQLLHDRQIEIGLMTEPQPSERFDVQSLFDYREVAVCAPDYPLVSSERLGLQQLCRERLLLLEKGTKSRGLLDQDFATLGAAPSAVMEFGGVEVQKACARLGLGVAIIPDFAAHGDLDQGRLRQITIDGLSPRKVALVTESRRQLSRVAKSFLGRLTDWSESPGPVKNLKPQ